MQAVYYERNQINKNKVMKHNIVNTNLRFKTHFIFLINARRLSENI